MERQRAKLISTNRTEIVAAANTKLSRANLFLVLVAGAASAPISQIS